MPTGSHKKEEIPFFNLLKISGKESKDPKYYRKLSARIYMNLRSQYFG